MAEEKEHFEERTVTLKVTKTRGEQPQPLVEPGNCGDWFLEFRGGHAYTCRWCSTSGPTAIPYKECVQLPD